MKKEFINDPMMEEIHKIRERHHEETKNLSFKEKVRRIEKRANEFVSSFGYKFIPTDHGTQKLVKA